MAVITEARANRADALSGRVGRTHCCVRPPWEPDMRVSPRLGSGKPRGLGGGQKLPGFAFPAERREQ